MTKYKVVFICSEYFGFKPGKNGLVPSRVHGGFGYLTRTKAEFLAKKGHEVYVVVPDENYGLQLNDGKYEEINGVVIRTYKSREKTGKLYKMLLDQISMRKPNDNFIRVLSELGADIYELEDIPPLTFMSAFDGRIPALTVLQDPFDYYDINLLMHSESNFIKIPNKGKLGYKIPRSNKVILNRFIIDHFHKKNYIDPLTDFLNNVLNKGSMISGEADFISDKSKRLFKLTERPSTLRNPIRIDSVDVKKYDSPTICWVARWDPQKRPDVALLVAKKLPEVNFVFVGTATNNSVNPKRNYMVVESYLKSRFSDLKNVKYLGFIPEDEKREIISRSWALLNTSIREGLPITFLEALSLSTPLISYVNPDNYVGMAGLWVPKYDVDTFVEVIRNGVKNPELLLEYGKTGRKISEQNHDINKIMSQHEEIYNKLLHNK
ncbi:MAG: glycosyltransferase family 4 protein [Candidatus Thermoplasmatota archaeon]|nr:glycosyltransferase family 4 protein [Candidatus Thermoplasmatota archaeon]